MQFPGVEAHRATALDERKRKAIRMFGKDRVPAVVSGDKAALTQSKLAFRENTTVRDALVKARALHDPPLRADEALTCCVLTYTDETGSYTASVLSPQTSMAQVYAEHKSNDEVLYLGFLRENVFGCGQ